MKKKKSQNQMIYEYLHKGKTITPIKALVYFGCFRLGARIAELKKKGHLIVTEMITNKKSHKRFASYRMIKPL